MAGSMRIMNTSVCRSTAPQKTDCQTCCEITVKTTHTKVSCPVRTTLSAITDPAVRSTQNTSTIRAGYKIRSQIGSEGKVGK